MNRLSIDQRAVRVFSLHGKILWSQPSITDIQASAKMSCLFP